MAVSNQPGRRPGGCRDRHAFTLVASVIWIAVGQ
jgi:hypothetical protein